MDEICYYLLIFNLINLSFSTLYIIGKLSTLKHA